MVPLLGGDRWKSQMDENTDVCEIQRSFLPLKKNSASTQHGVPIQKSTETHTTATSYKILTGSYSQFHTRGGLRMELFTNLWRLWAQICGTLASKSPRKKLICFGKLKHRVGPMSLMPGGSCPKIRK